MTYQINFPELSSTLQEPSVGSAVGRAVKEVVCDRILPAAFREELGTNHREHPLHI